MENANAPVIAVRQLSLTGADGPRPVVVEIHAPVEGARSYGALFTIRGLPEEVREIAGGVDSAQALLNAFHGVNYFLLPYESRLVWLDGDPGDSGFPPVWGPARQP